MVSNHIIVPIWIRLTQDANKTSGDVRGILLISRRLSIAAILALGFLYFRLTGGSEALASIGLIAFAGLAQIVPPLIAGLFWRGATRNGAIAGLSIGSIIWAYTLFLPSFGGGVVLSADTIANGLFGWESLKPRALFGLSGMDPLVHAVFWSLSLNICALIFFSLTTVPDELERLQSALFVDVFRRGDEASTPTLGRNAASEDLYTLAQRILGTDRAYAFFLKSANEQGKQKGLPDPSNTFVRDFERELSGSVGSASAHAMVSQIAGGGTVSVDDLMNIADETAQILQYSQQLESQSKVLEVIERARQNVQALEGGERLTFALPKNLDDQIIMADPDRAAQVLINLFTNVVKYGNADAPKITLTTNLNDQMIELDVHDNGQGIAQSDHAKVFEKFTRLTSKDLAGSAGLGLPISREIMRNLGGDLELLDSQDGTTFRATFKAV